MTKQQAFPSSSFLPRHQLVVCVHSSAAEHCYYYYYSHPLVIHKASQGENGEGASQGGRMGGGGDWGGRGCVHSFTWHGLAYHMAFFFFFGVAHLILDLSVVLMQCIQSNLTQSQRMDTVILSEAGNKTQPAKSGCCSRK